MVKKIGETVIVKPLEVKINGSFEEGYRKFKSEFQKEKIISQLKERQFYEKPSEKKRRKRRENRERQFSLEMREKMMLSGEWDKRLKRKMKKKQDKENKRSDRYEELYGDSE